MPKETTHQEEPVVLETYKVVKGSRVWRLRKGEILELVRVPWATDPLLRRATSESLQSSLLNYLLDRSTATAIIGSGRLEKIA